MDEETPTPNAATDDIVRNLVDLPALLILSATANGARTVRDLSMELNLPIATLYRKVRALQISGALVARKIKDRATGKETMVYESAVDGLHIRFNAEAPVFEVGYRSEFSPERRAREPVRVPPAPGV